MTSSALVRTGDLAAFSILRKGQVGSAQMEPEARLRVQ